MVPPGVFHFDRLSVLAGRFPWIDGSLYLPDQEGAVIFSEQRDGLDEFRCLEAGMNLAAGSSSHLIKRNIYVLSVEGFGPDSDILLRRRGVLHAHLDAGLVKQFDWSCHEFVELPDGRGVTCGLAQCPESKPETVNELLRGIPSSCHGFLLGVPSCVLFGQMTSTTGQHWLKENARKLVVVDHKHARVKLNFAQVMSSVESSNTSGFIMFGNEDFGGVYCFCFGDEFRKLRFDLPGSTS